MLIRFTEEGDLELSELGVFEVDALQRIPELLESQDPLVRDRLVPNTYDDPDEEKAWRELVEADLEHLIADRARILRKDLAELRMGKQDQTFELTLPVVHRKAWEASLTAASHAAFLLSGLKPEDAERDPGELGDPELDLALLRIRIYGALLSLMLGYEGYTDLGPDSDPEPDFDFED